MANESIKAAARKKRVHMWEIAEKLEVSDNTLFRMMRHELPKAEKEKILNIIDELNKKQN